MGDPTFPDRITVLRNILNQSGTSLFTRLAEYRANNVNLLAQREELQGQVVAMRSKLSSVQAAADTYDREFLDRPKPSLSLFSRGGLNTLQDWLLATFFGIYALVVIALTAFTALVSTKKAQGASIVLGSGVILGIFIAAVIARFA